MVKIGDRVLINGINKHGEIGTVVRCQRGIVVKFDSGNGWRDEDSEFGFGPDATGFWYVKEQDLILLSLEGNPDEEL